MSFTPCKLKRNEDGDPTEFQAKLTVFGHNDLCMLPELSKAAILATLNKRFMGEVVYTYVGDIIVSVNPFKNVGCVGKAIRAKYKGAQKNKLMPHIYQLVDQTYSQMRGEEVSQSILISGESGAGKTEAMKICLTYIGEVSGSASTGSDSVASKLMQTNPVMEAIGNAKTIRNNNSSRFGKHFDIQFDDDGKIAGAFTSCYLLEKPRICNHMAGERNYHVFYMICKATTEQQVGIPWLPWEKYGVLKQQGTIAEVTTWDDKAEMKDMCVRAGSTAVGHAASSAAPREGERVREGGNEGGRMRGGGVGGAGGQPPYTRLRGACSGGGCPLRCDPSSPPLPALPRPAVAPPPPF